MELWDAYDENRKPLGYTVKREKFDSLNNEYHIVVHIWIKNSKGEYLIQKRSSNKKEGPAVLYLWVRTVLTVL